MVEERIKKAISEVKICLDNAESARIDLWAKENSMLTDFRARQRAAYRSAYFSSVEILGRTLKDSAMKQANPDALDLCLKHYEKLTTSNNTSIARKIIDAIRTQIPNLELPQTPDLNVPEPLKEEINTDLAELNKSFNAGCYRSCIMISARILEVVLHRKYYETTGIDLLETNPGIGLGNLIAKLAEKGTLIDPALGNQIHLINQLRVFSVHKKQIPFNPSREQTQAVMLYTIDVVKKLFAN